MTIKTEFDIFEKENFQSENQGEKNPNDHKKSKSNYRPYNGIWENLTKLILSNLNMP